MSDELLPCPFCGAKEELEVLNMGKRYFVQCNFCGGRSGDLLSRNGAVKLWNERTWFPPFSPSELGVRPIPCVRDEHGETKEQPVRQLIAKIDEELNELKAEVMQGVVSDIGIAMEGIDTITAITTLLEAMGIDADRRDEEQRRVNEKNRERGRL